MTLLLLTMLAYSTQNEALFSGSVPEKAATFQATVRGSEPFYAGVRINGKWINDSSVEIPERQEIELVPDVPWQTAETYRFLSSKVELKYEASAMRRDRLQKTLAAHGYSLRETANGWIPVRDVDVQYAERMRKMLEASRNSATVAASALAPPPEPAAQVSRGNTQTWLYLGAMVAIPVVCLVGIFFVAKKAFMDDGNPQRV